MTALDMGTSAVLFVTNVLKNIGSVAAQNGFVSRIVLSIPPGGMPSVSSESVIATRFSTRTDMAALVIGPTGVGLGADGVLYVADTLGNQIVPILHALTSPTVGTPFTTAGLNGPLGLAIAPNGDIIVVNSLDGVRRSRSSSSTSPAWARETCSVWPSGTIRECISSTTAITPWISSTEMSAGIGALPVNLTVPCPTWLTITREDS